MSTHPDYLEAAEAQDLGRVMQRLSAERIAWQVEQTGGGCMAVSVRRGDGEYLIVSAPYVMGEGDWAMSWCPDAHPDAGSQYEGSADEMVDTILATLVDRP